MRMRINLEHAGEFGKLMEELEEAYARLMGIVNRIRSEYPEVELEIRENADD